MLGEIRARYTNVTILHQVREFVKLELGWKGISAHSDTVPSCCAAGR
jgi:hypothetical protein